MYIYIYSIRLYLARCDGSAQLNSTIQFVDSIQFDDAIQFDASIQLEASIQFFTTRRAAVRHHECWRVE